MFTTTLLLLALVPRAGAVPPGWTEGHPAAGAAQVLTPPAVRAGVDFPRDLVARLEGPTVLFYFSPNCPHCQAVAAEVSALAERLSAGGRAHLLGVASGGSTEAEIAEFRKAWGATFEITHDASREVAAAMGARSTPSALLVRPAGKAKVDVLDAWYPYVPGFDALVELRLADDPWSVFRPGEYLGSAFCGTCHDVEFASMQMTHHAIAWRTLVRAGKSEDPACTGCHVTGAGQPGGWDGRDVASRLVNVGCEACHGAGGPHDGSAIADPRATCAACHDEKHSLAFTVDAAVPLVDHYLRSTTTDAGFEARLRELYAGDAPRELLRFQSGANVGAAACLTCHPSQHAQWSASPHAAAMDSLRPDGKGTDLECVRCHATPTRTGGPPPTELGAYRTLEGVGCESCHGPGEAHVAAGGGSDNIERLGDDCPVCVIEAVCTSCHTEKWDPDWNLDHDLPRVGHDAPE